MKIPAPKTRSVTPAGSGDTFQSTPRNATLAMGAGVGAAVRGFGQDLGGVADEISRGVLQRQAQHNETVVKDLYAADFSPKLRAVYQEYYALQGKTAVDQRPAYEAKLHDLLQKSRDPLVIPDQQRLFDAMAKPRLDSELESMGRYANAQNKVWQDQTSDATLKTSLDDAADKWNDEDAFGAALGTGLAEIDQHAVRSGQSAEVARARADEFIGTAWVGRIQSAAVHDPLAAQALYDANRTEIPAAARPGLERSLKAGVMPVQAKLGASAIIAKDVPPGRTPSATQIRALQGKWMDAAEKAAEQQYPGDPVYRDLLQSQIHNYASRIAGAEEAVARNARNAVLTAAMTPNADGSKASDINTLLASPGLKAAWARMEPPEQMGVLAVLKQNSNPELNADAMATYHELRGLAVNDPVAYSARLETDFASLAKKLPKEQMMQLINQDTAIAKADVKLAAQSADASRIHRVTDGLLVQAGFKIPKKDEKKQKVLDAYQNYTSRMLDVVEDYTQTHKKKPNDIELRDMAQRLLVQGYEAGSGTTWFGYTMFRKEQAAFEADANFAVPAPKDEIPKIRAAYLKTFKREPSPEEIDRWYAARLLQGKK